jgi:hypothetical protein
MGQEHHADHHRAANSGAPVDRSARGFPIFENLNHFKARKFFHDFTYRASRVLAGTLFGATETELVP